MDRARATLGEDARAVAWWVLVGAAAGAIAGCAIGGIGGRLVMLLLRLTSPDIVLGATSDDGFEIGVVTTDTIGLIAGMTMLGGINGVAYGAVRGWLPRRGRLALWAVLAATLGGSQIVHTGGIDFTLLEPVALAIALFVVLPGAAAALVVVLTERWVIQAPFARRRLSVGMVVAAVAATFALVLAAAVGLAALACRRTGIAASLRPVARIAAPIAIVVLSVVSAVELIDTSADLL